MQLGIAAVITSSKARANNHSRVDLGEDKGRDVLVALLGVEAVPEQRSLVSLNSR